MNPPTLHGEPVAAYIGLGANLGDRLATLRRAVILLGAAASCGPPPVISSLYATDPVDCPAGQPTYLNAVAGITTRLPACDLLRELLGIEASLGRVRSERNASRVIDLDLLLYGQEHITEPDLIIPHPGMAHRRFVLEPLAELAPQLFHPLLGSTIVQLAAEARDRTSQSVRRICDSGWMNGSAIK